MGLDFLGVLSVPTFWEFKFPIFLSRVSSLHVEYIRQIVAENRRYTIFDILLSKFAIHECFRNEVLWGN